MKTPLHNFYAGPSIIAPSVLQEAADAIINRADEFSVIEISHRSDRFKEIIEEARELVKELAQLDDDFEVLFLQGGGRQQFFQVPFNLLSFNQVAAYVETGSWAKQAAHEASFFGKTHIAASSNDDGYKHIPTSFNIIDKTRYLHITSNNTIYGTQFHSLPQVDCPLVADMSSDLFSRPMDFNQFGLIYSAAQKNAGTAGTTLVMIRKSLLEKEVGSIPTMIDYNTHINKASLYNTPPTFSIYMSLLVLRWIKEQGGLSHFEMLNQEKAELMYKEIDRNPLFTGYAKTKDRSIMNAVFNANDPDRHHDSFLKYAEENGVIGIKGHSSVGGFRASMYNALTLKSVQTLVEVMQEYERTKG